MIIKRAEKERLCPDCSGLLIYKGQSAVREDVELWQCPSGTCYPKTFHLNADGTLATPPPFPGKRGGETDG